MTYFWLGAKVGCFHGPGNPYLWGFLGTLAGHQILVYGFGNGEDGLIEENIGAFEGLPALFGVFPAQELVRIDSAEVPHEHFHLAFVTEAQRADGEGFGIAGFAVENQGFDICLFLFVVGGVDKAAGFADYVADGIVNGVSGLKVLGG